MEKDKINKRARELRRLLTENMTVIEEIQKGLEDKQLKGVADKVALHMIYARNDLTELLIKLI